MVGFVADDLGLARHHPGAERPPARERARVSMHLWAADQLAASKRIYTYYFDRAIPWPAHPEFGAFHSGEIPYFFNTLNRLVRPWEPARQEAGRDCQHLRDELCQEGRPERIRPSAMARLRSGTLYDHAARDTGRRDGHWRTPARITAASQRAEEVIFANATLFPGCPRGVGPAGHINDSSSVCAGRGFGRCECRQARQSELEGAAHALGASRSRRHLDHRRHEGCADVPAAAVRHAPIPHRSGVRRTGQAARQRARHRRRQNGNLPQRRGLARVQLHVDGDRSARWPRTADDAPPRAPVRARAAHLASGRGTQSRTSRSTTAASRAARSARSCRPSTATARASCRRPTPWSSPTR